MIRCQLDGDGYFGRDQYMDTGTLQQILSERWMNNTLQQYLVAAGVFLGVLIALPIAKGLVLRYLKILSQRTRNEFDDVLHDLLRRVVGPLVYVFTALYSASTLLSIPDRVGRVLQTLFITVVAVKVAQILQGIVAEGIRRWTNWAGQEDPTTAAMLGNINWAARFVIWTVTLLFVLSNLGVNVTAGVAGLGIGGVAVALAAQAILGDAFSSFAIFADKPFNVGDFIIVGDLLGTVEQVGFKTTRLRSLSGEELIFANSDLTSSRIRNYKRNERAAGRFQRGGRLPDAHRKGEDDPDNDSESSRRTLEHPDGPRPFSELRRFRACLRGGLLRTQPGLQRLHGPPAIDQLSTHGGISEGRH